ncbi:hypothetical protein AArc1_4070 (plasmid) [Natrarchaeobaculum sulfurireducens]|uniref:Uncharacterized protein n=1 Tax=Natrarchaeobaculum sulfurireducens TaxID=2044521 RepID=A0A346P9J2_9EURY|nr:hypothetical protein AArc1_4070 [Natrarchaeobaculum sulfurireducens]
MRDYTTREDATRALIFDFAFYTDYRFSQVKCLFRMTGMRNVFVKMEIDGIVEEAYEVQNGRSYPPSDRTAQSS